MKIRNGFVSNSSSSSFTITNKTGKDKTVGDLLRENIWSYREWDYKDGENEEEVLVAADQLGIIPANEKAEFSFTNEGGSLAEAFLRHYLEWGDAKESDSFKWSLNWNSQSE
jgi:hypothetical protein